MIMLISLSALSFGQENQSQAVSNYFFISSGNWNDGTHWNTGEVPPEGCDVIIMADAVIPAGYTAIADQVCLQGGSVIVADGGQLKHNTQGLVVTMEKSIAAFNEVNSWSNYYLLAFPFNEDVAVPATMTAAEDNDFYIFDPDYPYAEWRNNKQHVITNVGGTTGYLYANSEDIELSLTGSTYQSYGEAAVTVEVPYTEGSSNIFNGWALLGNPFTCNAYVYALENGSCVPKEFMVYNAEGELVRCSCSSIAPMQGFFVKVEETTTICIKTTAPYVDLGLPSGTLWAACNVGAITPEDYGDYFAWGEIQPKDTYNWSTYQYCNGSSNTLTKYCSDASFGYNGFSDTLTVLLPEDDAATANWGSDWRMPTNEEWQELYNNTTHVWTMQDGVNGRLFTAENGNSLFLPAGGIYSNGSIGSIGNGSYYWSSSLSTDSPNLSWQSSFYSNGCNNYEFARFFGLSVRPVRSGIQSTSYNIDATANPIEGGEVSGSGTYLEDAECTLIATANEGYTFTNWMENNEVVSTEAVYIFTVNADRTLVANFTYNGSGDHDYVDLGLPSGLLWATCNVGADAPEDYGDYFAWGETVPKDYYDWSTYQYSNGGFYDEYGFHPYLTKYCNNSEYGYNGYTDNLTILLLEDDAATANWGSDWRMPTKEEFQELYNNTTVTRTTQNGVNGGLFTASNGNSLFLPAAGFRNGTSFNGVGTNGYYWSSSLSTDDSPKFAMYFGIYSDNSYGMGHNNGGRNCGRPVRAVRSGTTNYSITVSSIPILGGIVTGGGTYQQGQTCTVSATANTDYTFTNWTENDEVVSTEAIYIFTVDADRTIVANFTYNGGGSDHDYVDLGLPSGLLWATCNVGAIFPEDYGYYFAWGETQPKGDFTYMWSTYQHCNGSYNTLTKYCNNSDYGYNGFIDNLTILQPEDDAATANWGVEWRMPTEAEWGELFNNTTCTWTTQNGINGVLFTASNGNSLFLPAAGGRFGGGLDPGGSQGEYWTSTLNTWSTPNKAYGFSFDSYGNYSTWEGENRSCGISIRAVRFTQPITPEYSITITSSPIGGGIVTGGGTYQQGQNCTVSAIAATGYTFTNWTENGSVVSTNANYTFTVNSNRTLVANFLAQAPNTYTISVSSNPTNGGSVTGGGTYQQGQSCTVSATANSGYTFLRWTENGAQVSTIANYTFTVTSNRTLVAQFQSNATIPTVTTAQVTNITPTTAVGVGNVTSSGGATVTERGICWSTGHNPTTNSSHTSSGTGTGSFTVSMTGLTANTTYYVRAYANNNVGTAYGNEVSFTTLNNSGSHEYVDLGLPSGTLWATCNVGANTPEDYGNHFAWGETQPKGDYSWSTYQYCNGSSNTLTKYCTNSNYGFNGFTDNLTTLLPADDAATANWGNDWRTPTKEEWNELRDNTTHTWTIQNGVNGRLFVASNGNSLFLPASGYWTNINGNSGNYGYYWSSSLYTSNPSEAWTCYFSSNGCSVYYDFYRDRGQSVRAVRSEQPGITYSITISANPSNGGTVSGGGTYQQGQSCTVSATAATGYTFTNWTENGSVVSTNANYTFTVNSNRTLVAHFSAQAPNIYTISVSSNPTNGGSVTGGGTYQQGQSCTVIAAAATGYTFTNWTENGSVVSTNAIYTFTVTSNKTLVAQFQSNVTIPTVTTAQVTNIASTTAVGGGNVTSSGGATVTERGICWSTGHNPTTSSSHASSGTGTGSFTVSMTGLTANTTYYVRTYAINNVGTAYGNEVSFTTLNNSGNHEYVDLGLPSGLLWATCNVGAETPEEYGYYFAWGEITTKSTYTWSTYQYCNGSSNTLTKYCNNSSYGYNGFSDDLTTLLPEDDAAIANWAGYWCIPTQAEWQELLDNTTAIWTTQNGVNGQLFTASNGNTLFLPAAGNYSSTGFYSAGSHGVYYSSSLYTGRPDCARVFGFNSWEGGMGNNSRNIGNSIRAVRAAQPGPNSYSVTVSSSPASGGTVIGGGTYYQGHSCTVSVEANNGFTFTNWTENGNVVSTNAIYTFTVTGNRSLVANFTYGDDNHEYVDLGLPSGLLWATCNVGADAPEDYGDYFAWGEIATKYYYGWSNYQYCNGDAHQLTKYCNKSFFGFNGFTDTLTTLLPEDDVANVNWGGIWRIPTQMEWQELYNNTTKTLTIQNGVYGMRFTAANGNSIFLPAAGCYSGNNLIFSNTGCYWSSSLCTAEPSKAWILEFWKSGGTTYIYILDFSRSVGLSVRPVRSARQN